jgi:hypothetical protein
MRNILYNLQKAVTLPEYYDELLLKGSNFLHERQEEIDRLIALYDIQHQADFTTAKFNASKLTMLLHLAQKQAIEALDLNIRLVEAYEQMDAKIEENTVQQILHSQHAMRVQVEQLLHANALQKIGSALLATQEKINPYDLDDMRTVLLGQKETFQDLINKNAVHVTENSKLRMDLSFMAVQYRDFVANIQATNGVLYTSQMRDPKVIIPRDDTAGGNTALTNAPMSHPAVQECLRDAKYTSFQHAKATSIGIGSLLRPRLYCGV